MRDFRHIYIVFLLNIIFINLYSVESSGFNVHLR